MLTNHVCGSHLLLIDKITYKVLVCLALLLEWKTKHNESLNQPTFSYFIANRGKVNVS